MKAVAAAIFVLLLTVAGAQAKPMLDPATRDALEGSWTIRDHDPSSGGCGQDDGDEGWTTYQLEFRRSGGSFRLSGEDVDWRGDITAARHDGKTIVLTLRDFKTVRITFTGRNRARWDETMGNVSDGKFDTSYAWRCEPAHPAVTARLSSLFLGRLSGADVYFVPVDRSGSAESCDFRHALSIDLIGPVYFSLVRNSDGEEDWFQILSAEDHPGGARLTLKPAKGRQTILDILWRQNDRIWVPQWSQGFQRCVG